MKLGSDDPLQSHTSNVIEGTYGIMDQRLSTVGMILIMSEEEKITRVQR